MNGHFVVDLRAASKSELRASFRRRPGRLEANKKISITNT